MRRELDKYGIQMPAFSKIGGMLASEVKQCASAVQAFCDRQTDCILAQTAKCWTDELLTVQLAVYAAF